MKKIFCSWLLLPLTGSLLIGAFVGILLAITQDLPQVEDLQTFEPSSMTAILASDGRPIKFFYVERRIPIPLQDVPETLVQSVIAVEDARFYQHFGLDIKGILRALWKDIRSLEAVEGGSTLTQQLSKVLFLTPEKTMLRKIREAILAVNIERRYSKEEILTLYLNQIYFGEGAYGVEAAAQTYFGKSARDLDLPECAMLAGIPRSPALYSPIAHPDRAAARTKLVLGRLLEEAYISREEYDSAVRTGFSIAPSLPPQDPAPYFTENVRKLLEERFGANMIYRGGITVQTTLDLDLQEAAEKAVVAGIRMYEERHPPGPDDPPVQASLLAVEPATGRVLAHVGGRDFSRSPFDRAIQAKRQPGSAFKPIIYAAALSGNLTPATFLNDSPFKVPLKGQPPYVPVNYSGHYYGPVTMRQAFERSLNAASVDLLLKVGYQPVIDTASKLGISADLKPYPALALGVFDVSLQEMVAALGAISNRGILVEPRFIKRIVDRQGQILWEPSPTLTDAISPQAAYLTTSLLEGVIARGTGRAASDLRSPVGGKTGTTNDFKDAWFLGVAPGLVAGVWVGFDIPENLGNGETGARAALP
ncbi:MAG: PBP1A family penicillin-binding protein, partial [Proteobacteria bacterium]|nr:PBP1A family penicillin-binding protein [Pseudomonadota bacterium]